jgi:pSer/pThr/pTyr-binding forkhead associated (FHA) protein
MKVKLKVAGGKLAGKTIDLPQGTFLVGRGQECDLRARSDIVSRRHCEIIVDDASVVIRDLESKNGTFVNDDRIVDRQELTPGDMIQVGPMRFELLIKTRQKRSVAAPQVAAAAEPRSELKPEEEPDAELADFTPVASDESDEDISQWLDDDDDLGVAPVKETALQDTDVPGMDDTRQVDLDAERTTDDPDPGPNPPGKNRGKQKPGKLPPSDSTPSTDSGSAAADVLKQFSRRK